MTERVLCSKEFGTELYKTAVQKTVRFNKFTETINSN